MAQLADFDLAGEADAPPAGAPPARADAAAALPPRRAGHQDLRSPGAAQPPAGSLAAAIAARITSPLVDKPSPAAIADAGLFRRNSQNSSSTSASGILDLSDPSVAKQLINDALADAEGFQIMTPEKFDEKRRKLVALAAQVTSLQNKIGLETRVREAAEMLVRSNASDPRQLDAARQQLADAARKIEDITGEVWRSFSSLVDNERILFMHIAGALKWQVLELQRDMSSAPTIKIPRAQDDVATRKKLASAESKVRELETHVEALKNTISRLEFEQEPVRRAAGDAQRDARRARENAFAFEESLRDATPPSQLEVNRMKLDLATCRAEVTDLREELSSKRDALANLQLQLDEDQSLIESKDRMIANLLGELEEATTQLELVQAGGKLNTEISSRNRNSALLRETHSKQSAKEASVMNATLGKQLREAVQEREKLKLAVQQERTRASELEAKVRELRSAGAPARARSARTNRTNGSSAAGLRSDSDTEPEAESVGRYGRKTAGAAARSPGGSEAELRDLQRRNKEQEAEIERLRKRAERLSDTDATLLRDINDQVEQWLGAMSPRSVPVPRGGDVVPLPSMQVLAGRIRDLLDDNRTITEKLKELQSQKEIIERNLNLAQDNLRTRGNDSEAKMSDLRRDYAKLQDELAATKTRLRESERVASQLQEVQAQLEDAVRRAKAAEAERDRLDAEIRTKMTAAERNLKEELQRTHEKYERERERIAAEHAVELEELQRTLVREHEDVTKRLQRELENNKTSTEQRIADAVELEVSSVMRRHQYELDDLRRQNEDAKAKVEARLGEETLDIRRRLESSEAELLKSKQQFFVERERLQERIDEVQEEARTLRAVATERSNEWLAKKKEYEDKLDSALGENENLQAMLEQCRRELEAKTREVMDLAEKRKNEIEGLRKAHEARVAEMQAKIDEFGALSGELEKLERDYVSQIREKEKEVERLSKSLAAEQKRAAEAVYSSQEASATATDQLQRVERLLRESERDIDRYRRLADEKDNEVLNLKKQLRQKDKDLLANVSGSGDSGAMRKLLEQKDREIEAARAETRAAMADIASLKRKVEQKDREIEDAKSEMRRRAKTSGDSEATMEEVDRLQMMLMELKTSRVQMMEELDNAQHAEQVLRTEVTTLKAELEKAQQPPWLTVVESKDAPQPPKTRNFLGF
ncbi:hypothetical protein HK105_208746 [Polyrhizophydium stewartii]|uniref:Up-regulated during septation protein 1 domain-containing protein n=1 Tax=Polyrhizophydium stewartii TaxID=2732419 RepID=A0ABR4MX33_9FUNG